MTIINPADGPVYEDNGITLRKIEFPKEESEEEAMGIDMEMNKNILYPIGERACGVFGLEVVIHAIVNDEHVTTKNVCVSDSVSGGQWNHHIDVPWPESAQYGQNDVRLYFVQPHDGSNYFETGYKDWPDSTIGAPVNMYEAGGGTPGGDPTDPTDPTDPGGGDPNGGGSGGGPLEGVDGRLVLGGLLAAGLYARSKRGDT